MSKRSIASTVATLSAACFIFAGAAEAAEIKVLASAAIKEAYGDFAPQFEKSSEHKITTTWAGTVDIVKKLQAGESFSVDWVPGTGTVISVTGRRSAIEDHAVNPITAVVINGVQLGSACGAFCHRAS